MASLKKLMWSVFDWGGSGWVDRLNSCYTVVILLIAAVAVTIAPVLTPRIACFTPAQFTNAHITFAHEVCWDNHAHYLPFPYQEDRIAEDPRISIRVYHHYLGLLLFGQAFMFYMINTIWQALQVFCGIRLSDITDAAHGSQSSNSAVKDSSLRYLMRRCIMAGRGVRFRLILSSMVAKFLFCVNNLAQIIFINSFVGLHGGNGFGIQLIGAILNPYLPNDAIRQWLGSANVTDYAGGINSFETLGTRFPRRVICDFKIRHAARLHMYRMDCVLPLSSFYESVYAAVWIWICFVCFVNFVHGFYWLCTILLPPFKDSYVTNRLVATGKTEVGRGIGVDTQFFRQALTGDAFVLVRHIGWTVSDVCAAEVVAGLWEEHRDRVRSAPPVACAVPGGQAHPLRAQAKPPAGEAYTEAIGLQSFPPPERT